MASSNLPKFLFPSNTQELAPMPVIEAAKLWLDLRRQQLSPGSIRDYETCIAALSRSFFRDLKLAEIHIGHFEQYQRERSEGIGIHQAGPSRINHELNTLSQVLCRAALWTPIQPLYKPLRIPRSRGRAIQSAEEKKHLFGIASSRRKWKVAYLAALLSVNTTAGPNEIRGLQLCDVDIEGNQIHIRLHVKNAYRDRWIPLNQTARWAVEQLLQLAKERGSVEPTHYLLPHRAAGPGKKWDPTRPTSSWRKAWGALCKEAAKKYPGLASLRLYDLRHTVITELLENPNVSEETVVALAGWVSAEMRKVYCHVRTKPKRDAVAALEAKPLPASTPTATAATSWVSFGSTIPAVPLTERPQPPQVALVIAPVSMMCRSRRR